MEEDDEFPLISSLQLRHREARTYHARNEDLALSLIERIETSSYLSCTTAFPKGVSQTRPIEHVHKAMTYVAPSGCPIAIAPPFILTFSGSSPNFSTQYTYLASHLSALLASSASGEMWIRTC